LRRDSSKSQSLLPREHAVNPALFFGVGGYRADNAWASFQNPLIATHAISTMIVSMPYVATGGEQVMLW